MLPRGMRAGNGHGMMFGRYHDRGRCRYQECGRGRSVSPRSPRRLPAVGLVVGSNVGAWSAGAAEPPPAGDRAGRPRSIAPGRRRYPVPWWSRRGVRINGAGTSPKAAVTFADRLSRRHWRSQWTPERSKVYLDRSGACSVPSHRFRVISWTRRSQPRFQSRFARGGECLMTKASSITERTLPGHA